MNAHDDVREQHARITKDVNLTALGRQDAVRKHIAEKTALELHRARATVTTMRAKLAERRISLQPHSPDRADVAGAVMRSEIRAILRGMPNGERLKILLAKNADTKWLQAVLEGPNFASGISDETRELIVSAEIEKAFPGQLTAIEEVEEAIDLVDAAARVAFNTAKAAGEFPSDSVLSDFVSSAMGNTGALDATIDREFQSLAKVAVAA